MIGLAHLNEMPVAEFTAALGSIFEHSPWVPERAAAARPFSSRLHLLDTMRGVVERASTEDQMALIRAHPQLGTRGRTALTQASAKEQRRAGLDACSAEELAQLDALNAAYVAKFSMPFILAVRGHDPGSIVASMKRRLALDEDVERRTALGQIGLIAGFRLADTVLAPAGAEILAMQARLMMAGRLNESSDSSESSESSGLSGWSESGGPSGSTGLTESTESTGSDASGAVSECIREWMLAAGLDVSADADGLMGRHYGTGGGKRLLLGVHYDTTADRLSRDESLGFLVGLAALQGLKSQGTTLTFDVLLLAWPGDLVPALPGKGPPALPDNFSTVWRTDINLDDWRGCVAWRSLSGGALAAPDGRSVEALLRTSRLDQDSLVLAREGTMSIVPRPVVPCTQASLDRAVAALQDLLLQTEKPGSYNG